MIDGVTTRSGRVAQFGDEVVYIPTGQHGSVGTLLCRQMSGVNVVQFIPDIGDPIEATGNDLERL